MVVFIMMSVNIGFDLSYDAAALFFFWRVLHFLFLSLFFRTLHIVGWQAE